MQACAPPVKVNVMRIVVIRILFGILTKDAFNRELVAFGLSMKNFLILVSHCAKTTRSTYPVFCYANSVLASDDTCSVESNGFTGVLEYATVD